MVAEAVEGASEGWCRVGGEVVTIGREGEVVVALWLWQGEKGVIATSNVAASTVVYSFAVTTSSIHYRLAAGRLGRATWCTPWCDSCGAVPPVPPGGAAAAVRDTGGAWQPLARRARPPAPRHHTAGGRPVRPLGGGRGRTAGRGAVQRDPDGVLYEAGPRTVRPAGPQGANTLALVEELGLSSGRLAPGWAADWLRGKVWPPTPTTEEASPLVQRARAERWAVWGLAGGLQILVEALAGFLPALGVTVRTGAAVAGPSTTGPTSCRWRNGRTRRGWPRWLPASRSLGAGNSCHCPGAPSWGFPWLGFPLAFDSVHCTPGGPGQRELSHLSGYAQHQRQGDPCPFMPSWCQVPVD
jgi:hypothetical protein